jgi:hypothetical protein
MNVDRTGNAGGGGIDELPYKWAEDGGERWHRVSSVSDGAATTLCGMTLEEPAATRWEPPGEDASRCRSCEIEGEGAPPNH